MKEASNASDIITPKGVEEILDEFSVSKLDELEPDQYQEFVDALREECEKEEQ